MCLNPIIMRNPVKDTLGGLEYIKVPCRHCSECADVASNDYVVRTIVLFNILKGYSTFFCTLTFDEDNCPRTTIYKNIKGVWKPIKHNVRCFNHELYRRFRKNFSEFWMDKYHKPCYILTTCEFGEHSTQRPHYHCIIFVPAILTWRGFKSIIERYWHYGFTKNISIAMKDGQQYNRSLINSVKYVTKYVCKANTKLPFYLRDNSFCTDYPPCENKVRVFVSKNYGSALTSILTRSNYVNDSVILEFDKKKKSYSLPYYYKRKYFTRVEQSVIDEFYPDYSSYPYGDRILKRKKYIRKSQSFRINGYDGVLFNNFQSRLKTLIFHYNQELNNNVHFRASLPTIHEDEYYQYKGDWSLSPTLFDDMCTYYLQARRPDSLSPLSLIEHRELQHKNLYFKYPNESYSYFISKYIYKKQQQKLHGLPWIDLARISFVTSCAKSYSMPSDYGKLLFYEHYKLNERRHIASIRKDNENDWYKNHYTPYISRVCA